MTQVVAALIWKDKRFMICQRPANKTRAFEWEFVGGKVEKGETLEQALIRECREEIGVEIAVDDVYAEVDHVYPDITIHLTLFNARLTGDEPKMIEHNDIKFINHTCFHFFKRSFDDCLFKFCIPHSFIH